MRLRFLLPGRSRLQWRLLREQRNLCEWAMLSDCTDVQRRLLRDWPDLHRRAVLRQREGLQRGLLHG